MGPGAVAGGPESTQPSVVPEAVRNPVGEMNQSRKLGEYST